MGAGRERGGATVNTNILLNIGLVTVPEKPCDDLAPGTLNSILKQAGLKLPAENLAEFNQNIVGPIEVIDEFRGN